MIERPRYRADIMIDSKIYKLDKIPIDSLSSYVMFWNLLRVPCSRYYGYYLPWSYPESDYKVSELNWEPVMKDYKTCHQHSWFKSVLACILELDYLHVIQVWQIHFPFSKTWPTWICWNSSLFTIDKYKWRLPMLLRQKDRLEWWRWVALAEGRYHRDCQSRCSLYLCKDLSQA